MPNGLAGSAQVSYPLQAPSGTVGAPSYTFAADADTGIYLPSAGYLGLAAAGVLVAGLDGGGATAFQTYNDRPLGLGTGLLAADVLLYRDAADTIAMRRAANAQTLRVYQSFTDTGNYTRFNIGWDGTGVLMGLTAAGTGNPNQAIRLNANQAFLNIGSNGGFIFGSDALNWWQITNAGYLLPVADNTYDIGVNGTQRVRQYFGVYMYCDGFIQSSEAFRLANRARIQGGASDGIVQITDWAGTDFGRFCFGGVTAAFPAIKRNGANLDLVPADGSASYIDLTCHAVIASSVYLSNIVAVGANNTYIALGAGGATHGLVNSAASFIIQVTGGAVLATFAGTGYLEMTEVTAPSAPAANSGRLYFEDNGAGKTRLMCLFGSGAAQQIAIEP